MYGTSMAYAATHGLGESSWEDVIQSGISTVANIYTAQQKEKSLAAQRDYELKLAKLTQGASISQAQQSGGETTQDGLFSGNKTALYVGLGIAGVAAVGLVLWAGGRRRRR